MLNTMTIHSCFPVHIRITAKWSGSLLITITAQSQASKDNCCLTLETFQPRIFEDFGIIHKTVPIQETKNVNTNKPVSETQTGQCIMMQDKVNCYQLCCKKINKLTFMAWSRFKGKQVPCGTAQKPGCDPFQQWWIFIIPWRSLFTDSI